MYKIISSVLLGALVLLQFSCNKDESKAETFEEVVVVANRGAGTLSFINAVDNKLIKLLTIAGSEPMYVVYVAGTNKVYVGDRAGKKVHVLDPVTKNVERSIPVGSGVFHMWADGKGNQLWVNNDVDKTISVIDLKTNAVVKTIALSVQPHDVFLNTDASRAYVSVFASNSTHPDSVFAFDTKTYARTAAVAVGKDPHLYHLAGSNQLFVPCQSGQVYVLQGQSLAQLQKRDFAGAHGIFPNADQKTIFVTNISGAQLYSLNASDATQKSAPVTTPTSTPHNLVVNADGNKAFVTHSGATATKVTQYAINNGVLQFQASLDAGVNPFGIAYYKRKTS
jgi:YVTN family beta-propeller protein